MLVTRLWPLGITQIACGESHSCALAHDGRVFCWGRGKYSQLGLGNFENATMPQHIRMAYSGQQVLCCPCPPLSACVCTYMHHSSARAVCPLSNGLSANVSALILLMSTAMM